MRAISTAARSAWRSRTSYLFLAPFTVLFVVFTVYPVVSSIWLSFTSFNMLQPPRWVGWQNYVRLFLADDVFLTALKNTLVFASVTGPLSYLGCFAVAWVINELKPKVRAFLTLLFYAPTLTGNAYVIWRIFFSSDAYGYANGFLLNLGIITKPILWLQDPQFMMPLVIVITLWMSLSTSFLVFIAGLQGIDRSLYEAGSIDGIKNRFQELWYLTLPAMRRYLMIGAILAITGAFLAAGSLQELTGDTPTDYATWTVMQHLNDYGLVRYEMGYASAIAFLLFASMMALQRVIQRALNKVGQ
jgi:multiple sugar transport system permease protein